MSAFCPDCGKVIRANKCRCGWESGVTRLSACGCGAPTQINSECWVCYENRTGVKAANDAKLYDNLKAVGLGKRQGETRQQYNERCKEYLRQKGYLGKVIPDREGVHESA